MDIGATVASNFFSGIIDEPAIYGHVLAAERILAHARAAGLAP
jgi:hypothetical protein